jgi:hypothetical protein
MRDEHAREFRAAHAEALIADHRVEAHLLAEAIEGRALGPHAAQHRGKLPRHAPDLIAALRVAHLNAGQPHGSELAGIPRATTPADRHRHR